MSLLLLKTRDLSWQDHTVNTEAMLTPARCGLLLNKHKALNAKCAAAQHVYDRQREQCLKDFRTSRRLLDRQRQRLLRAKREAYASSLLHSHHQPLPATSEPSIASGQLGVRRALGDRSVSAPGSLQHCPKQGTRSRIKGTQPRLQFLSNAFLTDGDSEAEVSTSSEGDSVSTGGDATLEQLQSGVADMLSAPVRRASRVQRWGAGADGARRSLGVKFTERSVNSQTADTNKDKDDDQPRLTLDARVRAFIADVRTFNARPPDDLWRRIGRDDEEDERRDISRNQATVEKPQKRQNHLSMWQVDGHASILAAFDGFCERGSPEELTRAMRLASRLKVNALSLHNQPIVTSMADFRTSRVYQSLVDSRD